MNWKEEWFDLNSLLTQVIDRSSDFFAVTDCDGYILFVNKAGRKMLQLSDAFNTQGTAMADYLHPSSHEQYQSEVFQKSLLEGEANCTLYLQDFSSKEPIPVAMRFFPVHDEKDKSLTFCMAFCKDLRESVEKEALRKLNESVQKTAKIGGWELDIVTGKTIWTDEIYRIYDIPLGTSTDRAVGLSHYAEKDQKRLEILIDNCIKGGIPFDGEFEFFDTKGKRKFVRSIGLPVMDSSGTVVRVVGSFQDVTESVKLHQELNAKSEELNRFFDQALEFLCIANTNGYFQRINPRFSEVLGYTEQEILSTPIVDFIHPEDVQSTIEAIARLSQGDRITHFRNRYRTKNGQYLIFDWTSSCDPATGTIYTAATDITKIIENERKLNRLITNTPGMVYQFCREPDGSMYFSYVSPKGYELYEMEPEDVFKNPAVMLEAVHSEDAIDLATKIEASANSLQNFHWMGRIVTPKGKVKWIEARSTPEKQDDGSILWDGLLVDVTKQQTDAQELEKQRTLNMHKAKLASIGELAAGVGHEINNPLAIANGNIDIIEKEVQKKSPSKSRILAAVEKHRIAAKRISTIVGGLRTFSRADKEEICQFDLREAIEQTASLVKDLFAYEGIVIEVSLPKTAVLLTGNQGRIHQVLMNLLSNARDAMKSNAKKLIKVRLSTQDRTTAILKVSDTGSGISCEIKDKIFDTFFTTKPAGEGTGIGLAMSASIVKEHHGEISFSSSGKGTTFLVKLPLTRVHAKAKELTGRYRSDVANTTTLPHVLVVDDERLIGELMTDLLEEFGCKVDYAASGEDALQLARSNSYDAVFTDLRMPKMNGYQFIEKLALDNLIDRFRIFGMSGGATKEEFAENVKQFKIPKNNFLPKPFTAENIQKVLAEMQTKAKDKAA